MHSSRCLIFGILSMSVEKGYKILKITGVLYTEMFVSRSKTVKIPYYGLVRQNTIRMYQNAMTIRMLISDHTNAQNTTKNTQNTLEAM